MHAGERDNDHRGREDGSHSGDDAASPAPPGQEPCGEPSDGGEQQQDRMCE